MCIRDRTNLVSHIQNIEGLQISQNKNSQRIVDIEFKDELIEGDLKIKIYKPNFHINWKVRRRF